MAERKWSPLWVVGLLVCMGLGGHVWRTRSHPKPEASRWEWPREELAYVPGAEERAGLEEEEEALAEEEDGPSWGYADRRGVDLGGEDWEVDLGEGGRLLWIPDLALRGPWRDGKRPLPGEVGLFEQPLPGGLCYPGITWLLLELHKNSFMGLGEAQVIGNNPKLMEALLPKFKSAYFHTPELDLYGPRDPKQKGNKPVSSRSSGPPKRVEVSVKMKVLTLCAGLSASACAAVQVRQVDTEWLEDCPKEARVAIEALGLGTGEPYDVGLEIDYTRRQETPLFMKEGPVVARWEGAHLGPDFPRSELGRRMKKAKLYGRAKSYGHRMSVQFDRLELADGRELPICAIGYDVWGKEPGLDRWGPGSHPGVRVGNDEPETLAALKELRPGEFPIAASTIWISFGMPFRVEWLSRR